MHKLAIFFKKSTEVIAEQSKLAFGTLIKDIQKNGQQTRANLSGKDRTGTLANDRLSQRQRQADALNQLKILEDRPLQNISLGQSKIIPLQGNVEPQNETIKIKSIRSQKSGLVVNSRIRQIQEQKRRIMQELKKLDGQIAQIKEQADGPNLQQSKFQKKMKISDDIQAKRQAQSLVKQLHLQKQKTQQKRFQKQQKQLIQHKIMQQNKHKQRQQTQKRAKQQKRLMIEKRMQEQRKKRFERRMVDKHSNQLISQLKKQQLLQRQRQLIPEQMIQYEQKRKLLQKKNIFNHNDIEEHHRKYKEYKSKQNQLRRERSETIRVNHAQVPKYGRNIWIQRIQQEDMRTKQADKLKQLNRRDQLDKRIHYGDKVKTIFMNKNRQRDLTQEKQSCQLSNCQDEKQSQTKPRTPDVRLLLPQIVRTDKKRQNKTDKKFKQPQQFTSNAVIQQKRSRMSAKVQQIKQRDPQQQQKLLKQKQRQMQIRKETKQRLKKLQNKSIQLPKPQKVKYQNYMSKVKIKRKQPHEEWKRIMSNQNMSQQEKYKEMLSKATAMENQAKIKQDLRKNGDEDAVNLYIGSIQAKLALLERF